jgi:23S rRNA G2445 N2-methylase RlmL
MISALPAVVIINSLLREVTVLDPACGSGSFLVGMLTVLDDLQERTNRQLGIEEDTYTRRKRIIGQSLYGVDVMPWAVHIAELRLWLQLMVETEIHPSQLKFRPLLPNLSFKIRPGDSLVQEVGGINFSRHRAHLDIPTQLKGKLTQFKGEKLKFYNSAEDARFRSEAAIKKEELSLFSDIFFAKQRVLDNRIKETRRTLEQTQTNILGEETRAVDDKTALALEAEIADLEAEAAQFAQARTALSRAQDVPFVWDIAFVEIFEGDKKGFDIVIGNPPYVRQEMIAPPTLRESDYTASMWRTLGKGKLVRLGDIAEVRFGIKTGANEFFYLDEEAIEKWGIEPEFLRPVIKSPRECKSIIINPADLKFKIFMCHEDKRGLKGTNALEYIEWGEEQGFHERPSCSGRQRWYDLGYWNYADLLWVETMYEAYRVYLNAPSIYESDKFYGILFSGDTDKLAVSLNSSLVLLLKLMSGFASLGQGALKTAVYEVKDFRIRRMDCKRAKNNVSL